MNEIVKFENEIQFFIEDWLNGLSSGTRGTYSYSMSDLFRKNFLVPCSLEQFSKLNFERLLDQIKLYPHWSETVKQARACVLVSFTRYLHRLTNGLVRTAITKRGANPTFRAINHKAVTKALTEEEWKRFILELESISFRDSLIAKCLLQGAKRVSEVLNAKVSDVDFEKNTIKYTQLKTGGIVKVIPVNYPITFMEQIKKYIEYSEKYRNEEQWLFVSNQKKQLSRKGLNLTFAEASKRAGTIHVHPHVLRASWVTWALTKGAEPLDMMIVTGHTGLNMISYYDKRAIEDNVTKKLKMI